MSTYSDSNISYDNNLMRVGELNIPMNSPATGNGGFVAEVPVKNSLAFDDIWITNTVKSSNWKTKSVGFYIDGKSGYAEFANAFVRGDLTISGTLTGVTISGSTINGGVINGATITGGVLQTGLVGDRIQINGTLNQILFLTDSTVNAIIKPYTDSGSGLQILTSDSLTALSVYSDNTQAYSKIGSDTNYIEVFTGQLNGVLFNAYEISFGASPNIVSEIAPKYNAEGSYYDVNVGYYSGFWGNYGNDLGRSNYKWRTIFASEVGDEATEASSSTMNPVRIFTDFINFKKKTTSEIGMMTHWGVVSSTSTTSTDGSFTDPSLNMKMHAYRGGTITCNGKTMDVYGNTATTFYGYGWSGGGNPGNAHGYTYDCTISDGRILYDDDNHRYLVRANNHWYSLNMTVI